MAATRPRSAQEAAQLLQAPWPGNVRQLINGGRTRGAAVAPGAGTIASLLMSDHDQMQPVMTTEGKPLKEYVEAFERMLIDNTMRRHKGSIAAVMDELCLPRRTLNEKMAKYGLQRSDYICSRRMAERHHIVILGHSRAGTTLLHEVLRASLDGFAFLDRETSFARVPPDGPDRIVTKRPLDVFLADALPMAARTRPVSVLACVRDPRALLTSRHVSVPGDYFYHADRQYFSPEGRVPTLTNPGLIPVHRAIRRLEMGDWGPRISVSRVRYEDVLTDPESVQAMLERDHGLRFHTPLASVQPGPETPGKLARALNGVRARDPSRIAAWRAPDHSARLRDQFTRFPELHRIMAEYGYGWAPGEAEALGIDPGSVPKPIDVVCLKAGNRYPAAYVTALQRAVELHLMRPHRFVCMTDDPAGIEAETMPVPLGLPGWWGKVALFAPFWKRRRLFFDLDTVVRGSVDDFAEWAGPFAALRPFAARHGLASGLMSIAPGFRTDIWQHFAADPQAAIARCRAEADPPWNQGDQRWLELMGAACSYWQDIVPGQVVSWKTDCQAGVPPAARVIAFHGRPDPHEVSDPEIDRHWRALAGPDAPPPVQAARPAYRFR
jgi:hypothetical protein